MMGCEEHLNEILELHYRVGDYKNMFKTLSYPNLSVTYSKHDEYLEKAKDLMKIEKEQKLEVKLWYKPR